jgi:hypothetical protein
MLPPCASALEGKGSKLHAKAARYAKSSGNPLVDPTTAYKWSNFSRFVMRNSATRILALGIKFMESLTLSPISAPFLIAPRLTLMAGYSLWVVGCPPRYVGHPPQEWFPQEPHGGNGWGVGRWRYRDTSGPDEK